MIEATCIMPTRGRREWAHQAVEMFRAQTIADRLELVIVDDLDEPSFDHIDQAWLRSWCGSGDRIIYLAARGITLGKKHNIACCAARGEIILKWDSDDIYTPDRCEHQVSMLKREGVELVGYNVMDFLESDGRRWRYSGSRPMGVSFCFTRDVWTRHPFPDIPRGSDTIFAGGLIMRVCDSGGRIVARIHDTNTSTKSPGEDNRWTLIEGACEPVCSVIQ